MTTSLKKSPQKSSLYFKVKVHEGFKRAVHDLEIGHDALILSKNESLKAKITPALLKGWELSDPYFLVTFINEDGDEKSYTLEFFQGNITYFQELFQKYRLDSWLDSLSENQKSQLRFISCTSCKGQVCLSKSEDQDYIYCPECTAIFNKKGDLHTATDKSLYNFCNEGYFLALWPHRNAENLAKIKNGSSAYSYDSLYFKTKKYLLKISNHALWMMLWGALFIAISFVQAKFIEQDTLAWKVSWSFSIVLLFLIVFHLFCIGSYHSYLMMRKTISKYFRPEPIEKALRLAIKGDLEGMLEEKQLLKHPGYLVNVARVCFSQKKIAEGRKYLQRAVRLCPNHPLLRLSYLQMLKGHEATEFKEQSVKIFSRNLFLPLKEIEERVEWPNL